MRPGSPPGPSADRDAAWLARVRADLDASVQALDGATRSRLNRARQLALAGAGARRWRAPAWGVTAATAALALALAGTWVHPGRAPVAPTPPDRLLLDAADFDLLVAPDELQLYEDLAFYRWLDGPAGGEG